MTVDYQHTHRPLHTNTCFGHDGDPHHYEHHAKRTGLCPQCWSIVIDQNANTRVRHATPHTHQTTDKPYHTRNNPQ